MVDRGQSFSQEIRFLDHSVTIKTGLACTRLNESFQPGPWSVLCGRGRETYNSIGNRRLRVLVEANLEKYAATQNKFQKTILISSIVDTIRDAAGVGGFVRLDAKTGRYIEIDDGTAKEKVGQMLRESNLRKNPAKLDARKEKRRARAQKKKVRMPVSSSASVSESSTSTSTTSCNIRCDGSVAESISVSLPPAPVQMKLDPLKPMTLENACTTIPPLQIDPLSLADLNTVNYNVFSFPDLLF